MSAQPEDVIEGEFKPAGSLAVAQPQPQSSLSLFGTDDPDLIIERAVRIANSLKKLITAQGFAKKLKSYDGKETDKEWVFIEGWLSLGAMLSCYAFTEWVHNDGQVWEARVQIVRHGEVIGAAQALCTRAEPNWRSKSAMAIESQAITRATSKAYRITLGFIMAIAGYEATPAEEMEAHIASQGQTQTTPPAESKQRPAREPAAAAASGETQPEKDPERERVVRRLFALIADYARVGGERGADLQARMRDEEQRHKLVRQICGKNRLRDMDGTDLQRFIGMVERRIDEAVGAP